MSVQSVTAARLTDGRPQLFAGSSHGLFTTWKVNELPDAGWTGWQPFPSTTAGWCRSPRPRSRTNGRRYSP